MYSMDESGIKSLYYLILYTVYAVLTWRTNRDGGMGGWVGWSGGWVGCLGQQSYMDLGYGGQVHDFHVLPWQT